IEMVAITASRRAVRYRRYSGICREDVGSGTQAQWQAGASLPRNVNYPAAKPCFCAATGSARAAKPRIGLERVDHRHEVVEADDPFELEAGAIARGPDAIGLDSPDLRQAHDHALALGQFGSIVDHETMRGNIGDMQLQIAPLEMLGDYRIIDRMPRSAALVVDGQLCAHRQGSVPLKKSMGMVSQEMLY